MNKKVWMKQQLKIKAFITNKNWLCAPFAVKEMITVKFWLKIFIIHKKLVLL